MILTYLKAKHQEESLTLPELLANDVSIWFRANARPLSFAPKQRSRGPKDCVLSALIVFPETVNLLV